MSVSSSWEQGGVSRPDLLGPCCALVIDVEYSGEGARACVCGVGAELPCEFVEELCRFAAHRMMEARKARVGEVEVDSQVLVDPLSFIET